MFEPRRFHLMTRVRCSVWQHVDCMGVDRNNIPENYMCELCDPRRVDKQRAVQIQTRKRRELAPLRECLEVHLVIRARVVCGVSGDHCSYLNEMYRSIDLSGCRVDFAEAGSD